MTSLTPPDNPAQLQAKISAQYDELSDRLQRVARYAIDHPNEIAMETIAVIAKRAEVQPSVLIRFAKAFGYSGFSEMQQVFKQSVMERSPSYNERIRLYWEQRENLRHLLPADVLSEFATANRMALENLEATIPTAQLQQTVALLAKARIIHIMGQRRSFPVATYLAYALNHIDRPAQLMDGVGGMLPQQMRLLNEQDVLIAISFHPYSSETAAVVTEAVGKHMPVIVITDGRLSPIAQSGSLCFEIKDADVRGFRSLTASLCLAQALAVSLALQIESTEKQREMQLSLRS